MADTEFEDSIPLALAEALLHLSDHHGEAKIYRDVPSYFPHFDIPVGLDLLGSADLGYSYRVVFATEFDWHQTKDALVSNLVSAGFVHFAGFQIERVNRGFVATNVPSRKTIRMCRDDYGPLSISFTNKPKANIVTLSLMQKIDNRTCSELMAEQSLANTQFGQNLGLRQYMPRLEVPESKSENRSNWIAIGEGHSSSNSADSEYKMVIDWSTKQVYEHFSRQITAQGWQLDSEALGGVSANATWTKSTESKSHLIGILTIIANRDSKFDLKFVLRQG